jgi:hypothetical protein
MGSPKWATLRHIFQPIGRIIGRDGPRSRIKMICLDGSVIPASAAGFAGSEFDGDWVGNSESRLRSNHR